MKTDNIYGALLGDFIGSAYEFDGIKKPEPDEATIFQEDDCFTDDSVMTIAVADCLSHHDQKNINTYFRKWGHRYPSAGYGSMFFRFVVLDMPVERQSYGNGAAMRISSVASFAKSLNECKELAIAVTETTHGHKEGIKGAVCTACCTWMALNKYPKDKILEFAHKYYDTSAVDYEELRRTSDQHGGEICQLTLPQALYCFEHTNSFEECFRLGISMGQDSDTLLAIVGSIAGAYYGIPDGWKEHLKLPLDMRTVLYTVENM